MTDTVQTQKGIYFEEFKVGMELETRGRTVTEADIVNFAGLSGDFNPMHTNAVYAAGTQFEQRVAHGLLVLGMASGLSYQMGFLEGTAIAFTDLEWKFRAPVFIGDTIRVRVKVTKMREVKQAQGGLVWFDVQVLNQEDKVTQKGQWTMLVASKPDAADE
jgi:3-hydroxybutyryl-CoA dehydratase